MSANNKRLDLRFGSFACSVQGFDDPVVPVQQVLRAIQHLLEETPNLADAGLSFDAEAIENLVEEVARRADLVAEDIDIAPGLVIVHRGENRPAPAFYADAQAGEPEAWTRPFTESAAPERDLSDDRDTHDAGARDDSRDDDAGKRGEAAYVNLFAPLRGNVAGEAAEAAPGDGAQADADLAGEDIGDTIAERFGRADADEPLSTVIQGSAEAAPPRDIFAETDDAEDGHVFADAMSSPDQADVAAYADRDAPLRQPDALAADHGDAADGTEDADAEDGWVAEDRGTDDEAARPNLFEPAASPDLPEGAGDREIPFADLLASATPGGSGENQEGENQEGTVQSLFGDAAEQPEPEEQGQGYTAAGLAEVAGAKTVPELMVAAAAWMVLLRGQSKFTRPEVMDVFDQIPGDHDKSLPSRIRGFGRAVRDGQIVPVDDKRFGLSTTEFDRFEALL